MKRGLLLSIFVMSLISFSAMSKVDDYSDTLRYEARYRYGFIKIDAGYADVVLHIGNNRLEATMNGRSFDIGDRIYAISDTLHAVMPAGAAHAVENVTYENAWYTRRSADNVGPVIDFGDRSDSRSIFGEGDLDASSGTMEAVTLSTDILGMFYYFKEMDYSKLHAGRVINMDITLPDGDIQKAVMQYVGEDTFNGRATYKMLVNYSYHGEMSCYPVTVQVDKTTKLPLLLSANIKIGHVELVLRS